jgi:hypothetical protein
LIPPPYGEPQSHDDRDKLLRRQLEVGPPTAWAGFSVVNPIP